MTNLNSIVILLLLAFSVRGTQYDLEDCEFVTCSTAVALSSTGDTIILPKDTVTWASRIAWTNKNLIIIGNGHETLILSESMLFHVTINSPEYANFRLSNFDIYTETTEWLIVINGVNTDTSYGWRIDHITFNKDNISGSSVGIALNGLTYGCIDNCVFANAFNPCVYVVQYRTGDVMLGDFDWSRPLSLGSQSAVYIEDCIFNASDLSGSVFDVLMGGRVVLRYSSITGTYIQTHAMRYANRGAVSYEVYKNTFNGNGFSRWGHIRSGTGVFFENVVYGYEANSIFLDNQRDCYDMGGRCDGNAEIDGNTEGEYGWPCLDQIGRASGGSIPGGQLSEPLYLWSNGPSSEQLDGSVTAVLNIDHELCITDPPPIISMHIKTVGDLSPHANGEVDYINNGTTPKPGYTPLVYPHSLRGIQKKHAIIYGRVIK